MSRSILPITLCLAAVVAVSPASAQGIIEFGGFGGYTTFDKTLPYEKQAMPGARFSVISGDGWNRWILEAEGAYATQGVGPLTLTYIPARARMSYALPIAGSASLLLGAGGVRNDYKLDDQRAVEYGYTGLAGFRFGLGPLMTLRLEGIVDYIANPANETDVLRENVNYGFQAGLSIPLYTDHGPVRQPKAAPEREREPVAPTPVSAALTDADRDGVADGQDACSATPAGATVDMQGCQVYRDTDNDGVIDPRDACPATIAGSNIDGRGCTIGDSDGDGVTNTADRCPGTAAGERVDATGCAIVIPKAVVDGDADADGVLDSRDRCPATPAGIAADAYGCPIPKAVVDGDMDGDSVPDSRDRCANTPAGTSADAYGCPILFKNEERTVTLRGVNFASGRDELTPGSFAVLEDVARQLIAAPNVRIEVVGHTDATGGRTRNISLSLARAEAVRAYLVMQGVPSERVVARGFGPDQPIANNKTPTGRAANRRVELRKIN